MNKHLVGQSSSQARNCKEQKKRRDSIKEKFPKTITFYTYEHIEQKIEKRVAELDIIFTKLGIQLRKSEIKSIAISYYVDIYGNREKKKILTFIYKQLVKTSMSVNDIISKLNRKFLGAEQWDQDSIIDYLLLKK